MGLKGYLAAGHESKGGSAGREREKDQPCAINSLMVSAAALSAETIIYSAPVRLCARAHTNSTFV
jgi:hypothetical protein